MSRSACPGCGVVVEDEGDAVDGRFLASSGCRSLFHQVTYDTLSWGDPYFMHQLAVDAYGAQHVGPATTPVVLYMPLVGLYLVWERGFTGKQVQRAHMALAHRAKRWPLLQAPSERAALTVEHVAWAPEDRKRNAITEWNRAVWDVWNVHQETIAALIAANLDQ